MSKTLRISTPGDLLAAVPHVLGFHPERSLVVMGVGPGAMCARVDHPLDLDDAREAEAVIVPALLRNGVGAVVLVSYLEDRAAVVQTVTHFRVALAAAGVLVRDAVLATEGRWWQVGAASVCGPEAGTPYDVGSHPLTARSVFEGHAAPAESRAAMAATLVGTPDADEGLTADLSRVEALSGAERREEALWLRETVRGALDSGDRLTSEVATRVMAGLTHAGLRDVVWAEISRENAVACVALFSDLVRRAPSRVGAPVAGLLAFAAWMQGNGALAWCAVDHCAALDPEYVLGHLVAAALSAAMPPQEWEPMVAEDLPALVG